MTPTSPVTLTYSVAEQEVHAIATFAGHRSTDSTLRYIHLSGRELAAKLNSSMAQLHTWRVEMLTGPAAPGGLA
jgi:integrase/recombinase XerD